MARDGPADHVPRYAGMFAALGSETCLRILRLLLCARLLGLAFLLYSTNTTTFQELLTSLFSECCSRSNAVRPDFVLNVCQPC